MSQYKMKSDYKGVNWLENNVSKKESGPPPLRDLSWTDGSGKS